MLALVGYYSYGPVSMSLCLSVTSRCSIETAERTELVLAWELSSTYATLRKRKFMYLQRGYFPLELYPRLRTFATIGRSSNVLST